LGCRIAKEQCQSEDRDFPSPRCIRMSLPHSGVCVKPKSALIRPQAPLSSMVV